MRKSFFAILLVYSMHVTVARAEVIDRVVAVVGSEIITLSDVRGFSSQKSLPKAYGIPVKDPLEALIGERLLNQEMERLGLKVTEEDLNKALREVAARNRVPFEGLEEELRKQGLSFVKYKEELSSQIRQMKFLGQVIFPRIQVSEEEIIQKAGNKATEEGRLRARLEILQSRAPEEVGKYLDELRAKSYVEIKGPVK